jgi:GNAT superfamily N-acetyltransferase
MEEDTMTTQPIVRITTMQQDLWDVADLLLAQQQRHTALDPHLHAPQTREALGRKLSALTLERGALVAFDERVKPRGAALPALWELAAESTLLAFLTPLNGITQLLTLPNPQEEDAEAVASALLTALSQGWGKLGTTGELIRWPSSDSWIERPLLAHGFQLDSVCALHPAGPLRAERRAIPPTVRIREARPQDEAVLLSLYEEELRYHEACLPFARNSPGALRGFRAKLTFLWDASALLLGAPLVLVAEQQGQVVAMAETTLLDVSADDEPGYTPQGRYGCIDNLCVHDPARGQGIGRVLVQAVFEILASFQLAGYVLWYNPGNPQANAFWSRMGFVPLWSTYQRLPPIPSHTAS